MLKQFSVDFEACFALCDYSGNDRKKPKKFWKFENNHYLCRKETLRIVIMAKKNKSYNGPVSVIEFSLCVEPWQSDKLAKYFKHADNFIRLMERHIRKAYIASGIDKDRVRLVNELKKIPYRIKENGKEKKNPKWQEKYDELKRLIETIKIGSIEIQGMKVNVADNPLFNEFGFISVFGFFSKLSVGNGTTYKDLGFDSKTLSGFASDYYTAWEKYLYGKTTNGEPVRMPKKRNDFTVKSFSKGSKSTSNNKFIGTALDLENHTITFKNVCGKELKMKYCFNDKHLYEINAMEGGMDSILMFKIVRKFVRGNYHYYIQFNVKGAPYDKGRKLGKGLVGIDPSTSGVVHYAENGSMDPFFFTTEEHEEEFLEIRDKIAKISRYLDRSKRQSNKDNFNEDGTVKKGKKVWKFSNNYKKAKNELTELYRRASLLKKEVQIAWANNMLNEGDVFNVEDNNLAIFAKRSKKNSYKKDGTQRSKKRYGKTIMQCAPGQALGILKNKVINHGGTWNEIPQKLGATGHDHVSGEYTKHKVNERIVTLADGTVMQRDLHSAFNLAYVTKKDGSFTFDDNQMKNKVAKLIYKQEQVFTVDNNRKTSIIGTKNEYERKKMKKSFVV